MVPINSAMSVITAPAATKYSAEPDRSVVANIASRALRWRSQSQTSQAMKAAARKCGKRAANSFTPSNLKLAAVIQVDNGGLAQNGTP